MASSLWKYLESKEVSEPSDTGQNATEALSAQCYTSQEIFELERRAIFSRRWLLTTHRMRLPNAGDWLRYDVAGYQYVLVRDREGKINGFHNICRHRAFPVVTEEQGSSRIFSCKYHGWSYGLNGKLAKAPGYQDLENFDKSQNGLLPVHVHIDENGFIWVNLNLDATPDIAWEGNFNGIDLPPMFENVKCDDYAFDHAWEMEGCYNWKIIADRYHHEAERPGISSMADLNASSVDPNAGRPVQDAHSEQDQITAGLRITRNFYFPNVSMAASPQAFFIQRLVPVSPTKSIVRYESYRHKDSSDSDFELAKSILKNTMSEDNSLCEGRQKDLGSHAYISEELRMDTGLSSLGKTKDRLAELEEKVNLILNGNIPTRTTPQRQAPDEAGEHPRKQPSVASNPGTAGSSYIANDPGLADSSCDYGSPQHSSTTIARAISLYFDHCHRQPVWCFSLEEPDGLGSLSEELLCSIVVLTMRYSEERGQAYDYAENARGLVMLRIANDGQMPLGRFYLGLAFQLCRSAMLDHESTYSLKDPHTERKKRVFWSLQLLEQTYGQQSGLLSVPTETWRPPYVPNCTERQLVNESGPKPPPLPVDTVGCSTGTEIGIWSLTIHCGWIWSKVRTYVSYCASNRLKEPWRHESMYSMILSDLTEIENRTPICHRYESVRFYERQPEEVAVNRAYWVPWLKFQFMYHAILTVLNHPFLYIMASQRNSNLAIPNSFWRRSSEQVLLHATWIVRMIDMVSEKELRLTDPFFAHAAAIAATVQLYYCCAADSRLKYKSRADLARSRDFLRSFVHFSHACEILSRTVDRITHIASGSDNMNNEDWVTSKIHLNIPLMWDILQFNCTDRSSQEIPNSSILHPSLTPAGNGESAEENSILEIIVTTSPEVNVNTADGGQAVPLPLYKTTASASSISDRSSNNGSRDRLIAPIDSLMFNTPWLWADSAQFGDVGDIGYHSSAPSMGDIEGSAWWDLGNL
ncbi:fungal specific transcription factor [Paecilomyces variotii No. 5]|uniref:Choline monooxygenase, chloroplastic n=1 Tax=Byssochlamys spectabilis (strain No. 5 / NBRC 109023) TaxID=1356009 RepID=V5HVH1_BYSSN|nr:fungal specific transcription factor [Paecilomyces variotii No. 5]